jgi:hypothetical protein
VGTKVTGGAEKRGPQTRGLRTTTAMTVMMMMMIMMIMTMNTKKE